MNPGPAFDGTSSLPPEWSEPEIVEDVVEVDGVTIHRAGMATIGPDGEEIGAAVERAGAARARAQFELLERVVTAGAIREHRSSYMIATESGRSVGIRSGDEVFPRSDDPTRWSFARSNGIALHSSWQEACRRAHW